MCVDDECAFADAFPCIPQTVFPNTAAPADRPGQWSDCAKQGIAVKPEKGAALLFWSMKVGGELDGTHADVFCVLDGLC